MRKLGAALCAVPVVVAVYLGSLDRRRLASRLLAGMASAAVIGVVVVLSAPPAPSVAVPASTPAPVSADLFMSIGTAHPVTAPFKVGFAAPMNTATVAGALTVEPETPHRSTWDATARTLTITPLEHWRPNTLYRVTVGETARSEAGGWLDAPVRTVVLTMPGGSGELAPTVAGESPVGLDTLFTMSFTRPMSAAAVRAALRTQPAIPGDVVAGADAGEFELRPFTALEPDTEYRIWFERLADADGVPLATSPELSVRTVAAPEVVRFGPRADAGRVERRQTLSVRFTEPMDRARTAGAFSVRAGGTPVAGKASWAEGGRVLVFDPSKPLPYDASVTMSVDLSARSAAGAPLGNAARETIRIEAKPKPTSSASSAVTIPTGGGGAASGTWLAVERYYLKLMNCTRTGGWVTSTGACSSPGGRDVAPLALSSGISSKVARPYAKLLATRDLCSHFIGGNPGDRLRRAGYSSYRWAENIGCRSGGAYAAVLGSHLFFQSEKSYNGGHYRNLMNAAFDRVGIGVWVSGGRVRLVVDFYHP